MKKSSRHSKITGNFGEGLILYWLSKNGYECAQVDHTGIDLIARRPDSREVMGISVKSRSRNEGTESSGVNLLRKDDPKILAACEAFRCTPYVAIVVDQGAVLRGYLLTLKHARHLYPGGAWGMTEKKVALYEADSKIAKFTLANQDGTWSASV